MILPQLEIQIIVSLVAIACAILGVFLVLRKMALISDAISHSILLGIVLGFFITQDLNSPVLILFAAIVGVITVVLVETIQRTKLVKEDTAIGLVFPALFSIGIILISVFADDIHLDIDSVLLGELAFAPFDRLFYGEFDLGPKSIWVMGTILAVILTLLFLFYKELKVSTFDASLSASLGISPIIIHYGLMSISSVTIVGAFDAVGAILVVALIIVPAATSYLLTDSLGKMIGLAVFFGVFSAIVGYWVAFFLDASIAGSMTSVLGLVFLITFLFAPKRGMFSHWFNQTKQKNEIMTLTLLLHLNSLGNQELAEERAVNHLNRHFSWSPKKADEILKFGLKNDLIYLEEQLIYLTPKGLDFCQKAIDYILTNRDDKLEGIKSEFLLFRG